MVHCSEWLWFVPIVWLLIVANDRGMWVSYKDLHHSDFLRNLKIMKLDGVSSQEVYMIFLIKEERVFCVFLEWIVVGRLSNNVFIKVHPMRSIQFNKLLFYSTIAWTLNLICEWASTSTICLISAGFCFDGNEIHAHSTCCRQYYGDLFIFFFV